MKFKEDQVVYVKAIYGFKSDKNFHFIKVHNAKVEVPTSEIMTLTAIKQDLLQPRVGDYYVAKDISGGTPIKIVFIKDDTLVFEYEDGVIELISKEELLNLYDKKEL